MNESGQRITAKKKLIEVALPLQAINRGCEEDKNRKTGHIRNLHKWFAPMPLPSWRAMLFAALVDDPGEHLAAEQAQRERERLMSYVERLSAFESYKDQHLLAEVRSEIDKAVGSELPTVVDPFCGGGSTVLEAQRLGLPTTASDLNPVPVLITTVLCRIPPLFKNCQSIHPSRTPTLTGHSFGLGGFKADIVNYAVQVRESAWSILATHYPPIDGARPFAYRWAWTVESPDPADQGLHTPLVSNWWLSRHKSARAWVKPVQHDRGIEFEIHSSGEPSPPTSGRAGATCLDSKTPITREYLRHQGKLGRLRYTMFAVASREGNRVIYTKPDKFQRAAALEVPACDIADIPMPDNTRWFSPPLYGLKMFSELFTPRQALALQTFASLVRKVHDDVLRDAIASGSLPDDGIRLEDGGDGATAYADAITAVLGLCVGKMAQSNNTLVRWFIDPRNGSGKAMPAFDRHAIPMVWDFVETNPFGGSVGDWTGPVLETALRAFDLCVPDGSPTEIAQKDARKAARGMSSMALVATDPPYYSNIGYADLSDFFYLWLREALRLTFPRLLGTVATPKNDELISSPYRHEGSIDRANQYFRAGFAEVFGTLAREADPRFPLLIVYAIKQAEEADQAIGSTGWEVFLGGLVGAGLAIVATWPVRTTTDTRTIGIGTNALASAIFVVGRSRPADARTVSRREFLAALKAELPRGLKHLQQGNIAPVDLAQAAIGPGMAVYTRYSRVLDVEGKPVSVREALALINQTLDEVLAEQEGDFDADSRWALAWFEQSGFTPGEYGVAETLSKAKNTTVSSMVNAGIMVSKGGKVRLLRPEELRSDWNPETDSRLTVWESVHHLVRALEAGGENAAADLVAKIGSNAEIARELAYRLYTVCVRKKRAQEALSYNGLVQSWPEITRLARESGKQPQLFDQE
jgi:putative DNA methylase